MSVRIVPGWGISLKWVVCGVALRFQFLQRANPPRQFASIPEGDPILITSYEDVYLHLEVAGPVARSDEERMMQHPLLSCHPKSEACAITGCVPIEPQRVMPVQRYGFKLFRYIDQRGPWLRVWRGRRRRRWILWGGRTIPSYEGEQLADLVCRRDAGERPLLIDQAELDDSIASRIAKILDHE